LVLGLLALVGVGLGLTTLLTRLWTSPAQTEAVGGPFTLVDDTGKTVTDRDYRGQWLLVYFGYTRCPDACPTALAHIANALAELGPKRAGLITPLFITVDPARDTPAVMRDYIAAFDIRIQGLTGSQAQVNVAEQAYRIYAAKHPDASGDYSMDHSSIIYVMSPDGGFAANFTDTTTVDAMVAKLRQLGA